MMTDILRILHEVCMIIFSNGNFLVILTVPEMKKMAHKKPSHLDLQTA